MLYRWWWLVRGGTLQAKTTERFQIENIRIWHDWWKNYVAIKRTGRFYFSPSSSIFENLTLELQFKTQKLTFADFYIWRVDCKTPSEALGWLRMWTPPPAGYMKLIKILWVGQCHSCQWWFITTFMNISKTLPSGLLEQQPSRYPNDCRLNWCPWWCLQTK